MRATRRNQQPLDFASGRQTLFQQFARIGQALASPPRLAMMSLLAHGAKTVDQLARATGQSLAGASAHLKVLRGACLVSAERRGRQVHCRLSDDVVVQLWLALRTAGEALLPEARDVVRQFASDPEALAPLSPEELAKELAEHRVTLIDLRPASEFAAAHLPGAINLPFSELVGDRGRGLGLTLQDRAYAYCRGPYCLMAREGTRILRECGLPVRRLPFSWPEWQASRGTCQPGATAAYASHRERGTSNFLNQNPT